MHRLDEELERFAKRRWEEPYPYLIQDARYEKVREDGAVRRQAVLIAIGINWEGGGTYWPSNSPTGRACQVERELLASLRQRSLHGVEFVVSDDHAGLRRAIQESLPEVMAALLRALSNAMRDSRARQADDDCPQELRWIYDRRDAQEARPCRASVPQYTLGLLILFRRS